jgi:hypothetical protein
MTTWGVVATVKAPEEQLLAFVAHHLALGAARIWLYFDEPDDLAFSRIAKLPRVTATRCTPWFWAFRGGRHNKHQRRQVHCARHAQGKCRLDWLGHLDVDEFLHAPRPVAEILADIPADVPSVRMDSFEAMHDPDLPDDIFTAHQFRGPLRDQHRALLPAVFGSAAPLIQKGSLGHTLGKSFCRPRFRALRLDLHVVLLNKVVLKPPFHPDLRILHFHAHDPDAWSRSLPFRLSHGAYHHPIEVPLKAFLTSADDVAIRQFYQAAMTLTPEMAALLQAHDLLITADLALRSKVERLLAGKLV